MKQIYCEMSCFYNFVPKRNIYLMQ